MRYLSYLELCRMVCPLREWYLPSTDLSPSRTHCLLAKKNAWSVSNLLWVLTSTFARRIPPQPQNQQFKRVPIHPTKVLPSQNSKEFKSYQQGRVELSALKKREVPLSIRKRVTKYGVQIRKTKFHPNGSPPTSSPLDISSSIRSEFG